MTVQLDLCQAWSETQKTGFLATWLINVLVILFQGLFPPGQAATIGVDFMIKTVEIEGEKIKVNANGRYLCSSY